MTPTPAQRFASAVASMPTRVQVPLWRAWAAASPSQRAAMALVAERRYRGARNAPATWGDLVDYVKRTLRPETPLSTLAGALVEIDKLVTTYHEQYTRICEPWLERLVVAVDQWVTETGWKPSSDDTTWPLYELTDSQHLEVLKLADKLYPEAGFLRPGMPCSNTAADREHRVVMRDWGRLSRDVLAHSVAESPSSMKTEAFLGVLERFHRQLLEAQRRLDDWARDWMTRVPPLSRLRDSRGWLILLALAGGAVLLSSRRS